jgi:citrate lyase subunit beta/citryl-CoA lyase
MRSLLFVPAHEPKKLDKALGSGVDVLIIDLEDAVPEAEKKNARAQCFDFVKQHSSVVKILIRINALGTEHAMEDLKATVLAKPWGVMLPKCEGLHDLRALDRQLSELESASGLGLGVTRILPIVTETAQSVFGLASYPQYEGSRLCGMLWGAEDLSADVGSLANRGEDQQYTPPYLLARSMTLFAASASDTVAVDAVYTHFRDLDGLAREARQGLRDGFTAKAAIHPDQVAVINEIFTPSEHDLAWAREVVAAFARAPSAGAIALDGKMLDRPHYKNAQRLLARVTLPPGVN